MLRKSSKSKKPEYFVRAVQENAAMSGKDWSRAVAFFLVLCIFLGLVSPVLARDQAAESSEIDLAPPTQSSSPPSGLRPTIRQAAHYAKSPDLRSLLSSGLTTDKLIDPREVPFRPLPNRGGMAVKGETTLQIDPVIQVQPGEINMPSPEFNFPGLSNEDNGLVDQG